LPKACCRTPREVDAADVVHSCFFSKGVFRDALYAEYLTARFSWWSNRDAQLSKFAILPLTSA
ncbi:MAG: hypothetical protein IJN43_16760, partial [Ruminococcus sp.]|nr:hypothetical protein [Ruminococcus sp.]